MFHSAPHGEAVNEMFSHYTEYDFVIEMMIWAALSQMAGAIIYGNWEQKHPYARKKCNLINIFLSLWEPVK